MTPKQKRQVNCVNIDKTRGAIIFLSALALAASFVCKNKWIALALMVVCVLAAVAILYRHLAELTDLSSTNPKMKTLKMVTVFNTGVLVVCVIFALLLATNMIQLEDGGRYLAAAILSAVMLFAGNIAPKLPFNKHTGLRLPWTVTDERTWIVAHRILGYVSIPLAFVYLAGVAVISNFEIWTLIVMVLWIGIPGGLSYRFFTRGTGPKA